MPLPQIDTIGIGAPSAPQRRKRGGGHVPRPAPERKPLPLSGIVCWPFLGVAALLVGYGLLVCWSAVRGNENYSFMRQASGVAVGLVLMAIVWAFDYRKLAAAYKPDSPAVLHNREIFQTASECPS